MTAFSSMFRTVECSYYGPVGKSLIAVRFFHFATAFLIDAVPLGQHANALLTVLDRSTDCRCRAGDPT